MLSPPRPPVGARFPKNSWGGDLSFPRDHWGGIAPPPFETKTLQDWALYAARDASRAWARAAANGTLSSIDKYCFKLAVFDKAHSLLITWDKYKPEKGTPFVTHDEFMAFIPQFVDMAYKAAVDDLRRANAAVDLRTIGDRSTVEDFCLRALDVGFMDGLYADEPFFDQVGVEASEYGPFDPNPRFYSGEIKTTTTVIPMDDFDDEMVYRGDRRNIRVVDTLTLMREREAHEKEEQEKAERKKRKRVDSPPLQVTEGEQAQAGREAGVSPTHASPEKRVRIERDTVSTEARSPRPAGTTTDADATSQDGASDTADGDSSTPASPASEPASTPAEAGVASPVSKVSGIDSPGHQEDASKSPSPSVPPARLSDTSSGKAVTAAKSPSPTGSAAKAEGDE